MASRRPYPVPGFLLRLGSSAASAASRVRCNVHQRNLVVARAFTFPPHSMPVFIDESPGKRRPIDYPTNHFPHTAAADTTPRTQPGLAIGVALLICHQEVPVIVHVIRRRPGVLLPCGTLETPQHRLYDMPAVLINALLLKAPQESHNHVAPLRHCGISVQHRLPAGLGCVFFCAFLKIVKGRSGSQVRAHPVREQHDPEIRAVRISVRRRNRYYSSITLHYPLLALRNPNWVRLFCVGGPEGSRRGCERHGKSYLTRRRRGEEGDGGGSLTGGAIPSA